jgi:hypothetical protein
MLEDQLAIRRLGGRGDLLLHVQMGFAQQIAYTKGSGKALFQTGRLLKTPILATYHQQSPAPDKLCSWLA